MYYKIFIIDNAKIIDHSVKCDICNNKLTSSELFLNKFNICKKCTNKGIAIDSKKRTKDKYIK